MKGFAPLMENGRIAMSQEPSSQAERTSSFWQIAEDIRQMLEDVAKEFETA